MIKNLLTNTSVTLRYCADIRNHANFVLQRISTSGGLAYLRSRFLHLYFSPFANFLVRASALGTANRGTGRTNARSTAFFLLIR